MAAPKRTARIAPSRHFGTLANSIVAATADDDIYRTALASFVAFEKDSLFDRLWLKVLDRTRARAALNCYATRLEDFGTLPFIRQNVSSTRLLSFYKGILLREADVLSNFVNFRDDFERAFIFNDIDRAQSILDECKGRFGESLWYLRSSILLHSQRGDIERTNAFVEECKNRGGELLVTTIFNFFQLLCDSGNAWLHLNNSIRGTIHEFDTACYSEGADLFSLLFSPNPLYDRRSYESCIPAIQAFPVIDIYQFFLRIGQDAAVEIVCGNAKTETNALTDLVSALAEHIDDELLRRANSLIRGKIVIDPTPTGTLILEHYELGRYEEAIAIFEQELDRLVNPVAYVNVIAKSLAYLNTDHSLDDNSVIGQLLTSLKAIYRVTGSTRPHEETICSIAVRLNGLAIGAHVQMVLYLALPQTYADGEAKRCSALSILVSPEATPMASSLWAPHAIDFGTKFGLESAQGYPDYRNLKRQICSLINQGRADQEIEAAFELLKDSSPLPKDYFELYSDYCLYAGKIESLVNEAAASLSRDPNYESCFPLVRIVELLDKHRPEVSLEQLIVLFFYSKFVSNERDSLLNEMFEEYLSGRAIPPSRLLVEKQSLTPAEVVFFRDICRQDVMDFLTCFDSVNELRSERVTILELLNERGAIDSDFRMREVEEIVRQVIVDSASSKFNSAKIYVDDVALRNKHRDFISSLIELYGKAKDDGKDRHILWDRGSEESGKAMAYLSGDKNAIVLRLINTLIDAFLFDEKFGLAKNLSTEIRHGFFSNLLNARLEAKHLLSEKGRDGYTINPYWRATNPFVPDKMWSSVVESLNTFSAGFDDLIATAEEWMNIAEDENQGRVFRYELALEEAATIRRELEAHPDPEYVAAQTLNWLWDVTEEHLSTMREKLNGEFRQRLDELFSSLLQTIADVKGSIPLVDLTSAITSTREEIKNDVTTAAEWFRRAADPSLGEQSLDYVFEIAIRSFEEVNRGRSEIQMSLPASFRPIRVRGEIVKALVIAVINLLDNCYKHSGYGSATAVSITGEQMSEGEKITIFNQLHPSRYINDPVAKMSELRHKLDAGRQMMKSEGGSGLGKANYQITSGTGGSRIDVEVSERSFTAVIYYEH